MVVNCGAPGRNEVRDGSQGAVATFIFDQLAVQVYADRSALGVAAAEAVAGEMREVLARQPALRMVFAAAPSQNELLAALASSPDLDWSRVTAFHMDEYVGLPADAPQSFGSFLRTRLFDRVHPGAVHLLDGTAPAASECERYAALLRSAPIDIVCLGIGENGHLAFNDPPVADFDDTETVKLVALDAASRRQQVNDGCFGKLADVPTHALTMTIPALLAGQRVVCCVPGRSKRRAVAATLAGPVATACPASILRTHPECVLYLDTDSYPISDRAGVATP